MKTVILLVIAVLYNFPSIAHGKTYESFGEKFSVKESFKTDGVIWGIAELSPSEVLLTLRKGKIIWLNHQTGESREIENAPKVWSSGQGGLLDIYVHKKRNRPGFI